MTELDVLTCDVTGLNSDFLKEFKGRARADYLNHPALNILSYDFSTVVGSNVPSGVLANEILREVGYRTVKLSDVERAIKENRFDIPSSIINTGVVLTDENGPRYYLADNLMRQLPKQDFPVMMPISSLKLRLNPESRYGLAFDLNEDPEFFYAPILKDWGHDDVSEYATVPREITGIGNFSSRDVDLESGLPTKLTQSTGERLLVSCGTGLLGVSLMSDLSLHIGPDLDHSRPKSRIIVIKDE